MKFFNPSLCVLAAVVAFMAAAMNPPSQRYFTIGIILLAIVLLTTRRVLPVAPKRKRITTPAAIVQEPIRSTDTITVKHCPPRGGPMVELDGLTDDQLLALGYLIEDGKTEASDGHNRLALYGQCRRWWIHVTRNHGHYTPRPLCDKCSC